MNNVDTTAAAEKNLDRLLAWIGRLDTKFSIILGIDTVMLGFLASSAPNIKCLSALALIMTIVASGLLALSLLFVWLGMYPRTKGPKTSLIFFGTISKMKLADYQSKFFKISGQEFINDLLEQCHINSSIIANKFDKLKIAYKMLFLSVIPWIYLIYTFKSMA